MSQPAIDASSTVRIVPGHPLVLSMGDPAGIGPEVTAACFAPLPASVNDAADEPLRAVVIGDVGVMRRAARALARPGMLPLSVAPLADLSGLTAVPPNCIPVLSPPGLPEGLAHLPWGQIDARNGQAAVLCIRYAAALVMRGEARALVTAPIHKEALAAAGETVPGHTELLAAEAGEDGRAADVRMMLANDELKTVLVTVHCSLRQAIEQVTFDAVLSTLRITHQCARLWGQPQPRMAVAGLNPHAGEGGLFGEEEIRIIAPAIAQARAEGMDASGPWAPDTVFMRARTGEFDVVIAQYHDQGLIPVKYLGVAEGVNVTLGLPFIRTSPDHGTAFDLAGSGRADPSSMRAAIRMALRLSAAG